MFMNYSSLLCLLDLITEFQQTNITTLFQPYTVVIIPRPGSDDARPALFTTIYNLWSGIMIPLGKPAGNISCITLLFNTENVYFKHFFRVFHCVNENCCCIKLKSFKELKINKYENRLATKL